MAQAVETVQDYTLYDQAGHGVKLSAMFGRHELLVVLHNMGKHCPNCALWGDEFNGMLGHLEKVAGFCVVGPDDPKTQAAYLKARGWQCRLYSAQGTSFIRDLGFEDDKGKAQPGVSILARDNGALRIVKQVNVARDKHCPSVLEVFWMLPGVQTADIAWAR
ncbi:MAG: DUF899 family protein [candidate division NC10 bacterium]|nr:DUF899 family protein [Candidatus Rokubacteria bacterium]MBI2564330.1 DUF899 family protein [candidate division NC10 bacterium]